MEFWKKLNIELTQGDVALLYVLNSIGSSPGRQGFKMMVAKNMLHGSIGGGMMEYNLVEIAKKQLQQTDVQPQIHRLIHRKNQEDSSGLICSGEQTVAIYVLTQKDKTWLNKIIKSNGKGILESTDIGIQFIQNQSLESKFHTEISGKKWLIREDLNYRQALHIVGGGHVSLALSKIAPELGFQVFVYDDRKSINTFSNNSIAQKTYVPNYADIAQFIPQGERHYVVIMSFMFDTDLLILRKLLPQKFKYLGMMGSKQKVKTLLHQLTKEGISSDQLKHLKAPIGLPISSQTPAEIAISILAEMIKVKNNSNLNFGS